MIPAKGFTNAKQRLSPLLNVAQRELLAEAMLRDVLDQVVLVRELSGVYVVTGDARVSEIASFQGIHVIREPSERGETEAVTFALAQMKELGVETVLILPGDIPLLRASDIEHLLQRSTERKTKGPFALLTPSHDRMGTNALLLSPPDVIKLGFGYDSFSYHLDQVRAAGLTPVIVENENIALDIDEPKDLERFLATAREGKSYETALKTGALRALPITSRSGSL